MSSNAIVNFAEAIKRCAEIAEAPPDFLLPIVEAEIRRTIAAGTDSRGTPWTPTQEGGRPLQNAAGALDVRLVGMSIVARLRGHYALHDLGRARGGVQREILPREITAEMSARIKEAVSAKLREAFNG